MKNCKGCGASDWKTVRMKRKVSSGYKYRYFMKCRYCGSKYRIKKVEPDVFIDAWRKEMDILKNDPSYYPLTFEPVGLNVITSTSSSWPKMGFMEMFK